MTTTLFALSGVAGATTASTGPEFPAGPVTWSACAEKPEMECGTLTVPIDYAKPAGTKVDIPLARRKASNPGRRVGALVINPGGPGASGIDFAFAADAYFSKEITAHFDVVGFDPRGTHRSTPTIKCPADQIRNRPSVYPKTEQEFQSLLLFNQKFRESCRAVSGPIYDFASSAEVVQDIDTIRRALGERKLNYFGLSYGTVLGQHYAERYGDRIRAMVIDANVDHSISGERFVVDDARATEESFHEWVKWNERTPSSPLHGKDIAKIWNDLLAKAGRGELTPPNMPTVTLTPEDLAESAHLTGYGPGWWEMSADIAAMSSGTSSSSSSASTSGTGAADAWAHSLTSIMCNDFTVRVGTYDEYRALRAVELKIAPNTLGATFGHRAMTSCIGFPKPTNPQRPLEIRNAPPILVSGAKYDPVTPHEWAVNVHRQARNNTVLVTYEGWGHGTYNRSDCTRAVNDQYLVHLRVPRTGTSCPAVEPAP